MQQSSMMLLILLSIGFVNCTNAVPPETEQPKDEHIAFFPFKRYPTDNKWTFILDTRNGKKWQFQWGADGDDYIWIKKYQKFKS
ncbi:MAG: hypothetical protein K2G01_07900 [Paramuribaculum sp.]|nr:hypothetical protein [Paramuribaculum sp.]MDE6322726.1 hypothetical protein [Paramuribaculum sp.]